MSRTKIDPKLEQALKRGAQAIRQADYAHAVALLNSVSTMVVDAAATLGIEADFDVNGTGKFGEPVDGLWPLCARVSLDGPVDETDDEELRSIWVLAGQVKPTLRVTWHRADGRLGRFEGEPLAVVAFITDVSIPGVDIADAY
jgi:hypothetical protein